MLQTNNERLLKAATEELQLRAKIDRRNKEERENEKTCGMERESIAWSIPKRNRGDARSEEVVVVESR